MSLQDFYNACITALFKGTPFPRATSNNERDMLHDFRTTMTQFHRSKWAEEATDIGHEYALETEALETQ